MEKYFVAKPSSYLRACSAWVLLVSAVRWCPNGGKRAFCGSGFRSLNGRALRFPAWPTGFFCLGSVLELFSDKREGKDFFSGRFYFRGDPECTMIARRFFCFLASS